MEGGDPTSRRLSSVRQAPDLSMKPPEPAKKFAPKIPVKPAAKPPPSTPPPSASASQGDGGSGGSGGGEGRGSGRGRGRDGGDRGGGGRGGRGRGGFGQRGGGAAAPSIVTFRGTGAGPAAHVSESSGWGGSRGDNVVGGRYAYSGSRTYKKGGGDGGGGGVVKMDEDGEGGVEDGVAGVDTATLPVTLPMTPRPPWEASMLPPRPWSVGGPATPETIAAVRKLVRGVSRAAAAEILGERESTEIMRSDRWTLEGLGVTPSKLAALDTRRLIEDPLAMAHASSEYHARARAAAACDLDPTAAGGAAAASAAAAAGDAAAAAARVLPPAAAVAAGAVAAGGGKSAGPTAAGMLGGASGGDRLLFLQLPASLPFRAGAGEGMEEEAAFEIEEPLDGTDPPPPLPKNPLGGQPAGRMGKLRVHASGRVTLKLGDNVFDMSEAAPCNFLQQVVARNREGDDLYHMGDVYGRLLVTPDLEGLLRSVQPNT